MNRFDARRGLLVLCLLIAATLPRALYVRDLRAAAPTYGQPEGGDAIYYHRVAAGDPEPRRAYFHSPLYPHLLRAVYRLAGVRPAVAVLLQHLLGIVSTLLVALTTFRLFSRVGPALLAGLLHAVLGPPIFYEGQILVEALLASLLACAALLLVTATHARSSWPALALGVCLGLAALCRPTALVALPIALLWLLRCPRSELDGGPRVRSPSAAARETTPRRRRLVWAVAGAALVVTPVTIRNAVVERGLVLITANSGLNLYIGNHPNATGTYVLPGGLWFTPGDPRDDFRGDRLATQSLGREASSAEVSAWWRRRALAFIREHPGRALQLLAIKAGLLVHHREHPQLADYAGYCVVSPTLRRLPTAGFLIAPALVGLALALGRLRRRPPEAGLALMALGYGVALLPFFVEGRLRASWLVLLAPFAALALTTTALRLWTGPRRQGVLLLLALVAASLLSFALPAPRPGPSAQLQRFGRLALSAGRDRQAIGWFRQALAAEPQNPLALEGLALALGREGRHEAARELLEEAARLWPRSGRVANNLGLVYQRLGRAADAEAAFRRALRVEPALAEAYANLGGLLESQQRWLQAREAYRSAVLLGGGAPWTRRVAERLRQLPPPTGAP